VGIRKPNGHKESAGFRVALKNEWLMRRKIAKDRMEIRDYEEKEAESKETARQPDGSLSYGGGEP